MDIAGALKSVTGLIAEVVTDDDLRAKLTASIAKAEIELKYQLLQNKTIPWVDAIVKIGIALGPFWRPLGSFMMTAFGAFCHYKGINIGDTIQYIFDGAFPAWMAGRQVNKHHEVRSNERIQTERERTKQTTWADDDF